MNYALTLPVAGIICFGFRLPVRPAGASAVAASYLAGRRLQATRDRVPQILTLRASSSLDRDHGRRAGLVAQPSRYAPFGLPMSQNWLYSSPSPITIGIYVAASVNLRNRAPGGALLIMAIRARDQLRRWAFDVALYKTWHSASSAGITGRRRLASRDCRAGSWRA